MHSKLKDRKTVQIKNYWKISIALGLALSIVSIPLHAYVMLFIIEFISIDLYIVWAISSVVPVFAILFPAGMFLFESNNFFYGSLAGVVGVFLLIVLNIFFETPISKGFIVEYVSIILLSGTVSYFGGILRRAIKG